MKKKRILTTLMAMSMVMSTTVFGESIERDLTDELMNTEEYINELNEANDKSEKYYENNKKLKASGAKKITLPAQKQEYYYFCGPATAQMILGYKGINKSQSTLADSMGTSPSEGTYVYKMEEELNKYLGNKYIYTMTSQSNFSSDLLYSIDNNYPMVAHAYGETLGISGVEGHFVALNGYSYSSSGLTGSSNVTYTDPYYNHLGEYTTSINNMKNSINDRAGFYIKYNGN